LRGYRDDVLTPAVEKSPTVVRDRSLGLTDTAVAGVSA
jgi:hypothetical protein